MNKLQAWLEGTPAKVALFLYCVIGLVQFLVIPAGIGEWFGVHWMIGAMCAVVLAWTPLVGQGLGLAAAVSVLKWHPAVAAALFLWPLWFAAVLLGLRYMGSTQDRQSTHRGGDIFDRRAEAISGESPASRNSIDDTPPPARTDRPLQSV